LVTKKVPGTMPGIVLLKRAEEILKKRDCKLLEAVPFRSQEEKLTPYYQYLGYSGNAIMTKELN